MYIVLTFLFVLGTAFQQRFYHIIQIASPEIFDFLSNLQSQGTGELAGFMTTELPAEFADLGYVNTRRQVRPDAY